MAKSAYRFSTLALLCALCLTLDGRQGRFGRPGVALGAGEASSVGEPVPREPPAAERGAQPFSGVHEARRPEAKPNLPREAGPKGGETRNPNPRLRLICPAAPEAVKAAQETEATSLKAPVRITNSIGMGLVLIPTGEFTLGSPETEKWRKWDEGPAHRARIYRPFYLGACLVTQAQYEKVMGTDPSAFRKPQNPVECVSWKDAMEFCRKLSAAEGKAYRLPTEAEWEYACRAGTATRFWWGESEEDAGKYANVADLTAKSAQPGLTPIFATTDGYATTAPVATYQPNAFGLYDMIGNVLEWCQTLEKRYPYRPNDGREDLTAPGHRIVRGGSWRSYPRYCRSASRYALDPAAKNRRTGFRVLCAVESPHPVPAAFSPAGPPH